MSARTATCAVMEGDDSLPSGSSNEPRERPAQGNEGIQTRGQAAMRAFPFRLGAQTRVGIYRARYGDRSRSSAGRSMRTPPNFRKGPAQAVLIVVPPLALLGVVTAEPEKPLRCSECKREPREDENPDDEWRVELLGCPRSQYAQDSVVSQGARRCVRGRTRTVTAKLQPSGGGRSLTGSRPAPCD
jgi:hypothetical protein